MDFYQRQSVIDNIANGNTIAWLMDQDMEEDEEDDEL